MTKDDLIRMAREAHLDVYGLGKDHQKFMSAVERFSVLVISNHVNESRPNINAEEKKWLQEIAYQHGGIGDLASHEFEFGAMVAASEREACAKICDELFRREPPYTNYAEGAQDCAEAIRARGQ